MDWYYFLFTCAYWVSVEDLKERSAPQEYAFIFVSVVGLLLFVCITGAINLYLDQNILSGSIVILVSVVIAFTNYLIFLRGRRFQSIAEKFQKLSHPNFKRTRIGTMAATFFITGLIAVFVSYANSHALR